jgi:transcriptional regulator NrdR family protein
MALPCPQCGNDTKVTDTRSGTDYIRRVRVCLVGHVTKSVEARDSLLPDAVVAAARQETQEIYKSYRRPSNGP